MAYARLRVLWTKWDIWDTKWGVLPGMSWKHEYPFKKMLEERMLERRSPDDKPDPFRPGWWEEAGSRLWGEELIVARYGPLFSRAYEEETYRVKMAERGIVLDDALDEFGEPLGSTGKEGSFGAASPDRHGILGRPFGAAAPPPAPKAQEAGVPPATAEPVTEKSRASSASPPVRQKQRRGRATKSVPSGDVESTALDLVRPGRVSKPQVDTGRWFKAGGRVWRASRPRPRHPSPEEPATAVGLGGETGCGDQGGSGPFGASASRHQVDGQCWGHVGQEAGWHRQEGSAQVSGEERIASVDGQFACRIGMLGR